MELRLIVIGPSEVKEFALPSGHLTVGRGADADIVVDDPSLSRIHASIHRDSTRMWVVDEGSTNGTELNGRVVPASGLTLSDGDEIKLTDGTAIRIKVSAAPSEGAREPRIALGRRAARRAAAGALVLIAALGAGVIVIKLSTRQPAAGGDSSGGGPLTGPSPLAAPASDTTPSPDLSNPGPGQASPVAAPTASMAEGQGEQPKLYLQMSDQERLDFIEGAAERISLMLGNRPYAFTGDVIAYIKKYVDAYASRSGTNSDRLWGERLQTLYGRATRYSPYIIRAFNERGVPPAVGLYLAMIETEYHDCLESPVGAKGLFQFMPDTARAYGVSPEDRCDVQKIAPAAAHYMADRIGEFGPDSMSVALAIAGYNRSPDSVRRDLHDVLGSENKERSFWTLVANSSKLDHYFQNENVKYVPKFFAAAIVGENPWAFGLSINPLSTYSAAPDS